MRTEIVFANIVHVLRVLLDNLIPASPPRVAYLDKARRGDISMDGFLLGPPVR